MISYRCSEARRRRSSYCCRSSRSRTKRLTSEMMHWKKLSPPTVTFMVVSDTQRSPSRLRSR